MTSQKSAWRQSVVYQIYPWTFNEDAGRDPQKGHGSIKGITEKIPYLKDELGVDAIWLSPFYPSPMVDGGYDIANFTDVDPALGSLADFDEMMAAAHHHGVRVMVDFIPNHSSDQHEWFQKSRRREGFDDWYIWHPGTVDEHGNRQVPNNWPCVFSIPNKQARERGEMDWLKPHEWTPPISQWTWDDVRQEYYLHSFAKEQPDLNWSNPFVREAMKDAMRFWLDRGVDGFRVDAINHIGKDMSLQNEEVNTAYSEEWNENPYDELLRYHSANYPEALHSYIWEMGQVLKDEKYTGRDLRMVLEAYMGESELRDLDAVTPGVASTFNFGALHLDWNAQHHKIQMDYYYDRLQKTAVGNQVNGNHDKPRVASRLGDHRARTAAIKNLFLPGMRFVYNGEELGLHDAHIEPSRLQDPNGMRDPSRTPMIWNDTEQNGGFSNADPDILWLPANQADMELSVVKQKQDPKSSFALYSHAMKISKQLPVMQLGKYVSSHTNNDNVLAYGRVSDDDEAIVLCNFSDHEQHVIVTDSSFVIGETLLSSVDVKDGLGRVDLRAGILLKPNEAVLVVPA
jgi:alpha-glucosidase